jgi:ATP-binding cassette subfamily B protein
MRRDYGYFEEDKLGKPYDTRLLKRLWPHIRPYRVLVLISVLLVSGITVLDLALPYLTKVAIDRYIVKDVRENQISETEGRIYTIELEAYPKATRVVDRYPELFEVEGPVARIAYRDLSRLDKSDLRDLRAQDRYGVSIVALVFLAMAVGHFALSFGNVMIMESAGQSIMHDLRTNLYQHIQGLSVSFFIRNPVGRLVTRVTSDIQNLHDFFTSIITVVFKDIFLLVGIAIVLIAMNWKLAMICFAVLPVVFLTTFYFSRMARDIFREARIKIAQINTRLQESIDGIRVIQLFFQEGRNYKKFKKLNHENYLVGMRQINVFAIFMPTIEILSSVTVALVIWYGGLRVLSDTLSLGVLVAFISYMRMFFRPIRDIAEKYNIMQSAMASSERIFQLLDTEERIPDPLPSPEPKPIHTVDDHAVVPQNGMMENGSKIEQGQPDSGKIVTLDGVWFGYGDEWILKDVSFEIQTGDTVAIVGTTGAGKSTLIHLLERFYDPQKGAVRLHGVDLRTVPKAVLRSRIALITQDVFLFADSIRNNILVGNPPVSDARLDEIVNGCGLRRLVEGLPNGLDTVLTEGGRTLSSGERQLIAFARALARDPEILILDEATSSVDTQTEHLIQEATIRLMEGRTGVVVAHRLSTIQNADRILTLSRGRITEGVVRKGGSSDTAN